MEKVTRKKNKQVANESNENLFVDGVSETHISFLNQ
jgi:hypothetical protein